MQRVVYKTVGPKYAKLRNIQHLTGQTVVLIPKRDEGRPERPRYRVEYRGRRVAQHVDNPKDVADEDKGLWSPADEPVEKWYARIRRSWAPSGRDWLTGNELPITQNVEDWRRAHPVRETLIYKDAQELQINRMQELANALGVELLIGSVHYSKSVPLPVGYFQLTPGTAALVRDNFYGVNIAVKSDNPLEIPLDELYDEVSKKWYEDEIERAANYRPGDYDFSTPEWYSKWSSASLVFDKNGRMFSREHAFAEGIVWDAKPYASGSRLWVVTARTLLEDPDGGRSAFSVLRAAQAAST